MYFLKFIRLKRVLVFIFFTLPNAVSFGQVDYIISRDGENRMTTKVAGFTLEGCPFYTFPIWQPGRLEPYDQQREMPGEIAYNVVTNTVYYRSSKKEDILVNPKAFEINGIKFISETKHVLETSKRRYYEVLYDGRVKFLRLMNRKITLFSIRSSYSSYDGYYRQKDIYYVVRNDNRFSPIKLTRRALMKTLGDDLKPYLDPSPMDKLSANDVINLLKSSGLD